MIKLRNELHLPDLGSRRRAPFWLASHLAGKQDADVPGFETFEKCFDRQTTVVDRLLKSSRKLRPVINQVHACMTFPYPCRRPFCPQCARSFRIWCTSEAVRLAKRSKVPSHVVTVILERVPLKDLRSVDLKRVKARLKTACVRMGLKDLPVYGGFEVGYDSRHDDFVIHAHLLVIGGTTRSWTKLRPLLSKQGEQRSIKVQPLRDPQRQLSYLLKFVTYHRPSSQLGAYKARAVPLPPVAWERLIAWWAKYEVKDFLFLHRLRIVGGHIVPSTPPILRPT